MLAAKTVTSLAFSDLTDKFRVGFHTLSNVPATDFLTVADFGGGSGNQRDKWHQKLFGVTVPMGNDTPLLDGVCPDRRVVQVGVGDAPGADRVDQPDQPVVPEELPHDVHRRVHEPAGEAHGDRGQRRRALIPAKSDDTMPVSIID